MHYSRLQGNVRAGVATIQPKDPNADIGQRKGPSKLDIKQARLMYKCGKLKGKYHAIEVSSHQWKPKSIGLVCYQEPVLPI